MTIDYTKLTEVAGDRVSQEQLQRIYTRYHFARQYCKGKDVLELGCGSGQGLGYIARDARMVVGGEYSTHLLRLAHAHYENKIPLIQLDAQVLPFKSDTFDIVVLFEAIYYLEDSASFVKECARILRPKGFLIICNANKDLPDFNPSPYSYRYFSPPDFLDLLQPMGFEVKCFGNCEVNYNHFKQMLLSFIKKTMVRLGLMPKTMEGKKLLKRLVFGKLIPMPAELDTTCDLDLPCRIDNNKTDAKHKVIFAVAHRI